jgi:predicted AlkP superfamily pyrophosphatase or phosphodiesterase
MTGAVAASTISRALIRPKLLVLVVLEQLRPDGINEISGQLSTGGLRRILYRGSHFPDCRNLASTFSSSSLTTLATGAWPSQHGIVADRWYDPRAKTEVRASGELLLATTLCAQVAAAPRRSAFVLGVDPTHTGLFAGSSGVRQFWLNPMGQFMTLGDPPDWLLEFNALDPIENKHNAKWSSSEARPGAPPLRTLTWDPDHPEQFLNLYRASPFLQEAQFGLAARLIEKERLGAKDTEDFVCIIASSTALLGHETGATNPLMREMVLALDRHLQFFMGKLDAAVGENGYNLVLVGAHGAPPLPPEDARKRMAVQGESVALAVDKVLQASDSGRVAKYIYPFLYLNTDGFRDPAPLREAAARAAMQHPAVAGFYTADAACSEHDAWALRFANSFNIKRSGDLMLSYRPEYVEEFGQNRGVSYGSLYNYDVQVPLALYGPSFRQGVFEAPVESVDVATTLSRLLGVSEPSSSVGRVLGEAFSE